MSQRKNSLSIPILLFVVFLILKLTNQIDWSWWWITSPLWIPPILAISLISVGVLFVLVWIAYTGKNAEDFFKKILKKD